MPVILAVDLGGSSLRAGLVDAGGTVLAEAAVPSPPPTDDGPRSEIDPQAWWDALVTACGKLAADHPDDFERIEGIAVCGVTRTQIFLDRDHAVLRPAMTWKDARAEGMATAADDGHPEAAALNAYHPAARLRWLEANEPETFAALAAVIEPKDYLNLCLTGVAASDRVSLQRLAAAAETHGGRALIGGAVLPPLLAPDDFVGAVRPGLPAPLDGLAGVPVASGSNDTFAAVLGLGALRPGMAYNISGTTEVFGMVGASPATAEGLVAVDWGEGLHHLGGPSQTGADLLRWLEPVLGGDIGKRLAGLDRAARRNPPLLFLPFLQGERVPFWNPDLRAAFLGADRAHGPDDFLWAALEGVALLNALVLDRAETAFGLPAKEVRFGGGGARSALWAQVKADVLDRPVSTGAAAEPGLLGAAALALSGLGHFPSLGAAQEALARPAATYDPESSRAAAYREMKSLFAEAHDAVAPVSKRLLGVHLPR